MRLTAPEGTAGATDPDRYVWCWTAGYTLNDEAQGKTKRG